MMTAWQAVGCVDGLLRAVWSFSQFSRERDYIPPIGIHGGLDQVSSREGGVGRDFHFPFPNSMVRNSPRPGRAPVFLRDLPAMVPIRPFVSGFGLLQRDGPYCFLIRIWKTATMTSTNRTVRGRGPSFPASLRRLRTKKVVARACIPLRVDISEYTARAKMVADE